MAYGRSKMLLNGREMASGAPPLRTLRNPTDERLELETLRSTNARLIVELAALKEREAQVQRLADRDSLTGLYNRRRMLELLDSAIAEAAPRRRCVGLLFIDLNGFKGINDEYGHAAGDKILTAVATRIAARVRNDDDPAAATIPTPRRSCHPTGTLISRVVICSRERYSARFDASVNGGSRRTLGHLFGLNYVVVMNQRKRLIASLASGLVLIAALTGCVVVPDQRHYPGGVVMVAPPAPRVEVYGVAPAPGYVWLGGYWSWVGDRHEWVAGHWEAPRPGHHWVAHQWVRQGDGWRMKPGHWERG